ncbi:hypothetical protein [Pseudoalteromonas byunsanensis]|uniref:Uncharacterized protein n=1 Tax=Pseudoalteromonas byunsanensis TaxID=327939 RepID=A0A1S1NEN2_9GAMM|nr:hypothetical protein [Pseudoalteromonas byunsanensis]OHU96823.1 hypothetical protein BIW53_05745 [Pseudoalteromonas byunsanensis]
MTIEAQITQLQQAAAEQTDASLKLANDVVESINEIDQVKVDITQTHELIKSNHQAINDWQTKTGKVTLKDFSGQSYQVDTLPSLIGEAQKISPHPEVMSKAQFDALRKLRKQQFAGSGFIQWGQHWASAGAHRVVNQGMWEQTDGLLYMGINSSSTGQGDSATKYPVALVDGVELRIDYVARNTNWCDIRFPSAPDGTKIYDSATGKVTQHASAAEAFNEKKNQHPNAIHSGNYDVNLEEFNVEQTAAGGLYFANKTSAGEHQVEIKFSSSIDTTVELRDANGTVGDTPLIRMLNVAANTPQTVRINQEFSGSGVYFRLPLPQAGQKVTIHSWQTLPSSEQVITSRKDLVFLESWHEKIADKDVVYPLGNMQFGASTYQDIPLLNNLVAQSYSAFGEWDQNTKGFGVKWSTLSDANRVKFLKNPEHNIYYDPEAKAYFQVRYRIRVIEGCGAQWKGPLSVGTVTDSSVIRDVYPHCLRLQGSLPSVEAIGPDNGMLAYTGVSKYRDKDNGAWGKRAHCQAIPIALVQRLNQGAFHPVYNPLGTAMLQFKSAPQSEQYWYHADVVTPKNTLDCFLYSSQTNGGSIARGATFSGRPDQYKYHDAIYAGQVEDLRLNANKLDRNQLREDALSKAVSGTLRGKDLVYFSKVNPTVNIDISQRDIVVSETYPTLKVIIEVTQFYESSRSVISPVGFDQYHVLNVTQGWISTIDKDKYPVAFDESSAGPRHIYFEADKPIASTDVIQIVFSKKLSAEFDSLPWVDIIGHPERIAATFPDGVVGRWLPSLEDGRKQLNRKLVNGSDVKVIWTLDDGVSWQSGAQQVDVVSNTTDPWVISNGSVALLSYQTLANFTQPNNVLSIKGSMSNVYATQSHRLDYGNRLQFSLNKTIGTRANSPHFQEELVVTKIGKHYPSSKLTWTNRAGDEPRHAPLSLDSQEEPSSAVKILSTIVEKNGLLYLQLNGTELQYDKKPIIDISESSTEPKTAYGVYRLIDGPLKGRLLKRMHSTATAVPFNDADWSIDDIGLKYRTNTDYSFKFFSDSFNWGDDQTIPIINGENTKTDLNGNTVKVFCHHTQLPLGIASH